MKQWETVNGKHLECYREGNGIKFKFKEGGELPDCLEGIYTSEREAELAAVKYLVVTTPNHKQGSISEKIKNAKTV